ncbi:MAG: hypothetical protein ACREIV_10100 [Planctomycetaceae bacterium]
MILRRCGVAVLVGLSILCGTSGCRSPFATPRGESAASPSVRVSGPPKRRVPAADAPATAAETTLVSRLSWSKWFDRPASRPGVPLPRTDLDDAHDASAPPPPSAPPRLDGF